MTLAPILLGLSVAGLAAVLVWNHLAQHELEEKRRMAMALAVRALGVPPVGTAQELHHDAVTGRFAGCRVTFRLGFRSFGKYRESWTEVDVELRRDEPCRLELRPETDAERAHRAAGRAIDVEMGDAAFDRAFVIEAVPAALAASLLTPSLRGKLLAAGPVRVEKLGAMVRLEKHAHVTDVREMHRLFEAGVELATGLPKALAAAEARAAATNQPEASHPYRPGPAPGRAIESDPRVREDQIAALELARERRERRERLLGWVYVGIAMLVIFAAVHGLRACTAWPR